MKTGPADKKRKGLTGMDENWMLQKRYESLGYKKIAPFVKRINSSLSAETWGRMLNHNGRVDLRTLLIMSAELNFNQDELRSVLLARGENIIAELISDNHIGASEARVLDEFRKLKGDSDKIKLIFELIEYMASSKKKSP